MGEIIMSVYSQVSAYSDYVDLQHYTGSLASRPQMSGAIWLSGSGVNDTQFHFNSKMETPGLTLDETTSVTSILDQDTMSSNSATALATQQSIKAYVDAQVAAGNDLSVQADTGGLLTVDLADDDFNILGTSNEIEIAGAKAGTEVTFTVGLPNSVTIAANLTASAGTCTLGNTTATALSSSTTLKSNGNLTVGPSQYGLTTAGAAKIASMSANWTNASRTVADLGTITTVDINGGTIDATTIGASSQTSGKFTTVSGSGAASFRGTLTAVEAASSFAGVTCTTVSGSGDIDCGDLLARTLEIDSFAANWTNASRTVADLGTITTVDINGGTADALVIGGASAAAGTFTDVSASADGDFGDLLARTLEIDSFAANWTNASRTVADLGTITTVDINGGSLDAVTIGSTSACTALTVNGAAAQSITSTGANNITLTAGNNLVFDAQGTDEDDGVTISLGTDTDVTMFTIDSNSGNSIFTAVGSCEISLNMNNQDADFTMNSDTSTDKIVFDAAENALIVYDGGAETMRLGGDATGDYALDVKDGSNAINKVRAAAFVTYSDERLKTDINEIDNALKTVNSIKAVNFTWKKDGSRDFGFLAQDLKKVIPQAVHGTEDGLMGVDYGRLTSILVKAIQEQSAQIEALKKKIDN